MKITTDYRPNEAVLEKLCDIDFVAVIGPTAAGKTTLINKLISRHPTVRLIVTDVSRPPRPGERDGIDYHFRSRIQMLERVKRREYVNLAPSLTGDMYASHPDSYPEKGVGIMAVWADAVPYFRTLPFASFTQVYVLPPDCEALLARFAERQFTPDQLAGRLQEIRESLQFAVSERNLAFIINEDLEQAVSDLWHIVSGHAPRVTPNNGRTIANT